MEATQTEKKKVVKFKGNSLQLTFGKEYEVILESEYFYTIKNDRATEMSFLKNKFDTVS